MRENIYSTKKINSKEENVYITAMMKSLKSWKWPEKPDMFQCKRNDVLGGITAPKFM
jgi:hypothetical protein